MNIVYWVSNLVSSLVSQHKYFLAPPCIYGNDIHYIINSSLQLNETVPVDFDL